MKYINKKRVIYKKKQNKFYLKKNIFFLCLIFIFLGIWTERFDLKIHIKNFTNDVINTAANRFF